MTLPRLPLLLIAVAASGCLLGQPLLPDGGVATACGADADFCTAQAKNCGALNITDLCGKNRSVTCGTCTGPQTCGGAGTANVCGASCAVSCPSGYACNLNGICAGGSATNLNLDVKTVAVSGTVTLNGAAPSTGSSCTGSSTSSKASVAFVNQQTGTSLNVPILCPNLAFTYSLNVPPGTYAISVSSYGPSWSSLPDGLVGVVAARTISAAESNLNLDVKTVPVSGVVTLNGAAPTTGSSCTGSSTSSKASVAFEDRATGTRLNVPILCPNAQFSYSLNLPTGTYAISVSSYGPSWSSLPDGLVGVVTSRAVSAAESNLNLDVKTVPVSGVVTLNGAAPTTGSSCMGSSTSSKASVAFLDEASGTALNVPILCPNAQFSYSLNVPPGSYAISVNSYGPSWSSLPDGLVGVVAARTVSAAESNLNLDVKTVAVSGVVTLNGAAPGTGSSCSGSSTSSKASVAFDDRSTGTAINVPILCPNAQFTYSLNLPVGTYAISVSSYGPSWSTLPDGRAGVLKARPVSAAESSLNLDVKTVPVSGTVTLNGTAPGTGSSCTGSSTSSKASVAFADPAAGTAISVPILCPNTQFSYSLNLPTGTYDISVSSYGPSWSTLPDGMVGVGRVAVP